MQRRNNITHNHLGPWEYTKTMYFVRIGEKTMLESTNKDEAFKQMDRLEKQGFMAHVEKLEAGSLEVIS